MRRRLSVAYGAMDMTVTHPLVSGHEQTPHAVSSNFNIRLHPPQRKTAGAAQGMYHSYVYTLALYQLDPHFLASLPPRSPRPSMPHASISQIIGASDRLGGMQLASHEPSGLAVQIHSIPSPKKWGARRACFSLTNERIQYRRTGH